VPQGCSENAGHQLQSSVVQDASVQPGYSEDAARGAIASQLSELMGRASADLVQTALQSASGKSSGILASVVGATTLLIAASGVFGEMQSALNAIRKAQPQGTTVSRSATGARGEPWPRRGARLPAAGDLCAVGRRGPGDLHCNLRLSAGSFGSGFRPASLQHPGRLEAHRAEARESGQGIQLPEERRLRRRATPPAANRAGESPA